MQYVSVQNEIAKVTVPGAYDLCNTAIVMSELNTAYREKGCTKVHIDLSKTDYMDSSAVRDCIRTSRKVGEVNFSVSGAKGKVLTLLKSSELLDDWTR